MDFKPTYKTSGTTSRKPSKNDRAMVSGVSSILRKIKDKKNRKEVAGSMVKQFNREGVNYNKEKFLKNSRSFAAGGPIKPYYTSNPNDPRLRTYNDSLSLYRLGEAELRRFFNGDPGEPYGSIRNLQDLNRATRDYTGRTLNNQLYDANGRDALNSNENVRNISNIYNRTGILPIAFWANEGFLNYRFKKPVQPVKYADPKIVEKQKLLKDTGLYTGELDGIWGDKSEEAWKKYKEPLKPMGIKAASSTSPFTPITSVNIPMRKEKPLPVVRHTTNYLEPDIIKHKNLDEGFYKEIRQELPKQKVTPEPKEIPVKKQPNKSNPKVVYQNYKKGGILESKKAKLSKLYKVFKLKK